MFHEILIQNLFSIPLLAFALGILVSLISGDISKTKKINKALTIFLLFSIGLKSGHQFIGQNSSNVLLILILLIAWGMVQPLISYHLLKRFTKLDKMTMIAIAACYGSTSVMTFTAGVSFLEKLNVPYKGFVTLALVVLEIPAIISGLLIYKMSTESKKISTKHLIVEALFNKTILVIFAGMIFGIVLEVFNLNNLSRLILSAFKPVLSLFLFFMGLFVGKQRHYFKQFSGSLVLFGLYMPLIGAAFGIAFSFLFKLDAGTSTLITLLAASASYIAAPAAMKIALPDAKEGIYLPLSLGVTFTFNVLVGIPLYYQIIFKLFN